MCVCARGCAHDEEDDNVLTMREACWFDKRRHQQRAHSTGAIAGLQHRPAKLEIGWDTVCVGISLEKGWADPETK